MTYTVQDVDRTMASIAEYGIEDFRNLLYNSPFILFGDIGIAVHAESQDAETDGGGDYCTSDLWLVFAVVDPTGTKRYFKRGGHYQSHCGTEWDDNSVEVQDVVVTRRSWEPV